MDNLKKILGTVIFNLDTIVVRECPQGPEKKDFDSVEVSDVVKFSDQNMPDVSFAEGLNALAEADCLRLSDMTEDVVRTALEKAQETASKSISYMGSKGMIRRKDLPSR